jgi:hypothetical protein
MSENKSSDYIKRLERRRKWLESRVSVYTGTSDSHDQAELSALNWAIPVLEKVTRDNHILAFIEAGIEMGKI